MEDGINPLMILTDQSRHAVQFWVIWALPFPRILIAWLQAEDVLLPHNNKNTENVNCLECICSVKLDNLDKSNMQVLYL